MKRLFTLSLLTTACLMAIPVDATAQRRENRKPREITVLYIDNDNSAIEQEIVEYYHEHRHEDYQGTQAPKFIITDSKGRAAFSIGGFVNMRTAYDMNRVMPDLDFIPTLIPMERTATDLQRVLMDASTSRIFMEAVIKTRCGDPLTAYVEGDFRGVNNAFHLRQAYVSYMGFKAGQSTSTFTDLGAAYRTIDFEGPNAYTYRRNLMLQYSHQWWNGLSVGVAIEYPEVTANYGTTTTATYQRVPDLPAYLQYQWGRTDNMSHLRLSGVVRNMFYVCDAIEKNVDRVGWGVQLSGALGMSDWGKLYGQALYGSGIGAYVADLMGMGYDMTVDYSNSNRLIDIPVMAWFLGMQFNLTQKMPLTLGYSQVSVFDRDGAMASTDYKLGQYVVANCFYDCNSWLSVGLEYLYGTKCDFGGGFGKAHRLQTAVQFNF